MGIAHKSRSFLIQGVSDEIQFLAGNIEKEIFELARRLREMDR
jgi:hypothetical protein